MGIRIELRPGLIAGGPTTFDELSQRATGLEEVLIERHAYANVTDRSRRPPKGSKDRRKKVIERICTLTSRKEGAQSQISPDIGNDMLKLPKSDYQVQPEDEDDQWFCLYCRKKVMSQSPKLQES